MWVTKFLHERKLRDYQRAAFQEFREMDEFISDNVSIPYHSEMTGIHEHDRVTIQSAYEGRLFLPPGYWEYVSVSWEPSHTWNGRGSASHDSWHVKVVAHDGLVMRYGSYPDSLSAQDGAISAWTSSAFGNVMAEL